MPRERPDLPLRTDPVRVDKWLWAARFFKTRTLSTEAIDGGKVTVNGERAKPAKPVRPGDEIRVRIGPYEHLLVVHGTAERRGTASDAARLFSETDDSRKARERLHWQLSKAAPAIDPEKGRPTKRDRRDLERFRGR